MRTIISGKLVAALLGAALVLPTAFSASAQVARPLTALAIESAAGESLTLVRESNRSARRSGRIDRRGSVNRGSTVYRGRYASGGSWGHRNRNNDWYYGAGGLALGLGLGLAASPYAYGPSYYAPGYGGADAVEYCMSRYRSYDPRSGTYLGYDGLRHPCP